MEEYDVVVVGAGPVGSVAARYACENGASVLMLEKRQEIGTPVRCGEGIAKRWLDEIGIVPDKKWIANEVDGARILSPDNNVLEVDETQAGDESGYVIHRDVFDRELAKEAAKAGCDIRLKSSALGLLFDENNAVSGVKVRDMDGTYDVKAKIVIGADGFESQVGRWAGINTVMKPKDIDTCYQYTLVGIDCNPRFNEFYIGNEVAPGGYLWVFPKGNDTANVGIGVQLSQVKDPGMAKYYLDKFIESRPEFAKGESVRDIAGAVSISAPIDQTVTDGLMLVGDAARQIDAVSGGGVYNGCIAAKFAGKVAADAVKAGDFSKEFLNQYEKLWRDRMENRLYRNWMVKEKFTTLSDDTMNKAVKALSEVTMEKMTVLGILQAIQAKYPELIKEFEDFV